MTTCLGKQALIKITPANRDQWLDPLISCYRDVFAGPPWDEWLFCPTCRQKWGIEQKVKVENLGYGHCGKNMEEFWPKTVVENDLRHEITKESSCWLVVDEDQVVGFCWGYPITTDSLEKKLVLPGLSKKLRQYYPGIDLVAYQDDLGVRSEYRHRGLAKMMFLSRLEDFRAQGLTVGVVRTKTNPPSVTNLWFSRLGYETVAQYHDADGRVVLACPLGSL